MSQNIDHTTLSWVKQEIDETLKQARHSLEEYVENPGDISQLRFAYNYVHQVHGTLQMVELYGASLLTEELEKLAQSLMNAEIAKPDTAYELFMRAIIQLPDYLEKIQSGLKDDPLILLPLINDLRSARGEQLLSENALFAPNIDTNVAVPVKANTTGISGQEVAKKLRHNFQVGLLGWYRNQDPRGSLDKLGMVLGELEKSCAEESVVRLWWVAGGLIEALHDEGLKPSISMNKILGQIDRCVKRLIDAGEAELTAEASNDLLTEILYSIARSTSNGVRVTEIRKQFKLEAINESSQVVESARETLTGPNIALLETVSVAVKEYLTQVKDALDLFLRSNRGNVQDLHVQSELLRKIADTLNMLSLEKECQLILDQEAVIDRIVAGHDEPSEEALMEIAHQLLIVESAIDQLAKQTAQNSTANANKFSATKLDTAEINDIQGTLLEEISVNMARIKDAIVSFIDSPAEHELLADVPNLFNEVQGGMQIIDLARPCSLIVAISRYVKIELIGKKHQPGQEELDSLADAIASVEYYLEAIPEQRDGTESMLQVATQALEKLGYPVEEAAGKNSPQHLLKEGDDFGDDINEQTIIDSIDNISIAKDRSNTEELTLELADESNHKEAQGTDTNNISIEPEKEVSSGNDLQVEEINLTPVSKVNNDLASNASKNVNVTEITIEPAAVDSNFPDPTIAEGQPRSESQIAEAEKASRQLLDEIDDDILEIFIEEAREELEAITEMFPLWKTNNNDLESLGRIRRAFHTLKGSGRLVGASVIGEFAWAFENLLNRILDKAIKVQPQIIDLISESVVALSPLIDQVEHDTPLSIDVDALALRAFAFTDNKKKQAKAAVITPDSRGKESAADFMDPVLYDIFSKESNGHIADITHFIKACGNSEVSQADEGLVRAVHTLHGSARMAGSTPIADIAGLLEKYTKTAMGNESPLQKVGLQVIENSVSVMKEMLQQINRADAKEIESEALLDRLQELFDTEKSIEKQRIATEQRQLIEPLETHDVATTKIEDSDYDIELMEVFLEEGTEILENSERIIQRLIEAPDNREALEEIQRELHTLKGGARMAGVVAIGDLSHSMESLLTDLSEKRMPNSIGVIDVLHQSLDRLYNMLELVQQRSIVHEAPELVELIETVRKNKGVAAAPKESKESGAKDVKQVKSKDDSAIVAEKMVEFPIAPPLKRAVPVKAAVTTEKTVKESEGGALQDAVRVRTDLLDNLVNFSGEVSIYRSRLEQQNNAMGTNLDEMGNTVSRLQEQLRKLEMETEAQILFNYSQESGNARTDFDPLELDRYSQVQELSRGLSESISDISSIKGLLDNLIRESDTLLLQQSRVNTDLQEGLMRTRMVPFSGIVTRLRRLVRQTAQELGKEADLEVVGEQGEMDRIVLERITAPVEHLIRNAIAHGLETPKQRKKQGKDSVGKIKIEISRQGSEVMLDISDDGAGMDLNAIRKKAIARGLINKKTQLSDHDVIQFVLESGFSTAEEVTQVSGRGVGMDVVNSEVKQLGGSFDINSVTNEGTTFTVLLPLTMAMNHAILVKVGEETYAIALSGIEGIVRFSSSDLDGYMKDSKKTFEYAEHKYKVNSLGLLLGASEHTQSADKVLPVLLVRSGDQRVALQVDQLLGSREVVVKSVGPQISTVRGISGATILGDGSVVLILDMSALIRMGTTMRISSLPQEEVKGDDRAVIMVVDDSITVRKVTTRLLERNDMNSITAKDGVDAIASLDEQIPDVMLLDIEMPRMDGFELASYMRNTPHLKDIPIIMITSRTGDKHRKRASDIGVDDYLGKPYQELDLINRIQGLLKDKRGDT
ncbi:Signal transduction histidine kinase CheA [hydrothermal vent metagenome]|uniref:histidine kinase n=1 Tax=hydrothermal vent metagenome TaxID=652676 RepID=A0A3B0YS98_9ZZZZ